jgi:uncharacterized BrkB/YihY/UPF0761 family membrane protein
LSRFLLAQDSRQATVSLIFDVRQKKTAINMKLRAFLVFVATLVFCVLGAPLLLWAATGFESGDNHGLWIPVMLGMYFGIPCGFLFGILLAGLSFLLPHTDKLKIQK